MKKNTIYFVIAINFLIIVALAIFLIGVNRKEDSEIIIEQDSLKQIEMIDSSLIEEYTVEKYNVKFSHLKEFTNKIENLEGTSVYKNVGFFNKETGEGYSFMIYTANDQTNDINEFMYSLIDGAKVNTKVDNKTIKVYENATLDGNKAFKFMYKNDDGINIYEIATIYNGMQYIFIYSGNDEVFNKERGEFLFTTVKFLNENN